MRHRCKPSLFSFDGDDGRRYADCEVCCQPVLVSEGDSAALLKLAAAKAAKAHPTFMVGRKQKYGPIIANKIKSLIRDPNRVERLERRKRRG